MSLVLKNLVPSLCQHAALEALKADKQQKAILWVQRHMLSLQVLADTAAADALAAKGASDVDAKQMQAMLRSLMAEAVQSSTSGAAISPNANDQAMLRYTLARHGPLTMAPYAISVVADGHIPVTDEHN